MSWMKMIENRVCSFDRLLKEEFCADPDPLHAYVRRLADLRRDGRRLREPCFFATAGQLHPVPGWRRCTATVPPPAKPQLVNARCGRWNLVFEDPPVCEACRLDARDLRRRGLAAMNEEELWASLLPAHWLTPRRGQGGQPELLVPAGIFMRRLGLGFALRTFLSPQRMGQRMTAPPDSYHVRRRWGRNRSGYSKESLLDRIMDGLEE